VRKETSLGVLESLLGDNYVVLLTSSWVALENTRPRGKNA